MLEIAFSLIKELQDNGFQAYIVGGFVRDYLLGIESNDIDITTDATPKEIKELFSNDCLPNEDYGSVIVVKKGFQFELTTFRCDIDYSDNRHPMKVLYIDDLYKDLLRRDFVINTLCMNENKEIIDYLGGQSDLERKVIRTVGNAEEKLSQDSLRILRAIRFATILDFSLDKEIISAIKKNKKLLYKLSYNRKKEELEKIFTSPNYRKGIKMILDLGLDTCLEISNLDRVLDSPSSISLMGIWAIIDVSLKYPFNKNELELIDNINKALEQNNLDPYVLYEYGLYVNSVAGEIKGIDVKTITESYNSLVIKTRDDISIDSLTIMNLLHREPGKYLKNIYDSLEKEILYKRLDNSEDVIKNYILLNYNMEGE